MEGPDLSKKKIPTNVLLVGGCLLLSALNVWYLLRDNDQILNLFSFNGTFSLLQKRTTGETMIFFNIFINENATELSIRIVNEQIYEIRKATSAIANSTIYYTTIGSTDDFVMPNCEPCEQLRRVPNGSELLTLDSMYSHCQRHTRDSVVYIHNKGSYTNTFKNEKLRQHLMKAVTSEECHRGLSSELSCNVCSTSIQAVPFLHYAGNMFVAKCEYINELLPPFQFKERKSSLMKDRRKNLVMAKSLFKNKKKEYQVDRISWIGVDRYSAEHWLGSHPNLQPCDVYSPEFGFWRGISYKTAKRRPLDWIPSVHNMSFWNESEIAIPPNSFHPWLLLPGRLFEWDYMYETLPKRDSWMWDLYSKTDGALLQKTLSDLDHLANFSSLEPLHLSKLWGGNISGELMKPM